MGLDAYARVEDGNKRAERFDTEFAYWRKNESLQNWMEQQYRYAGGTGEFNCQKVYLTKEILNELEIEIKEDNLPDNVGLWQAGYFYGSDSIEDYKEPTLKFISDAHGYLNDGYKVYYCSWW